MGAVGTQPSRQHTGADRQALTWLNAISLALKLIGTLVSWLRERDLIKAGEAQAIAEGLEISNARVTAAIEARRRARESDPDPDDPYRRD